MRICSTSSDLELCTYLQPSTMRSAYVARFVSGARSVALGMDSANIVYVMKIIVIITPTLKFDISTPQIMSSHAMSS